MSNAAPQQSSDTVLPPALARFVPALANLCAAALVSAVVIVVCNVLLGASVLVDVWQGGIWWVWLPLVVVGWWRTSAAVYVALLAVLGATYVWYAKQLGVQASPEMIEGLLNTNPDEVVRLASRTAVLLAAGVAATVGIGVFGVSRALRGLPAKVALSAGMAWFAAMALTAGTWSQNAPPSPAQSGKIPHMQPFPDNLLQAIHTYQAVQTKAAVLRANKQNLAQLAQWQYAGENDLLVIFVRGESARAQSFSLLGYREHDTNPRLRALPDVVPLPHLFSYRNYTAAAVPFMFTRATPENTNPTVGESSYLAVFRQLGFDTRWIGSDRTNLASFASPILAIAQEAEHAVFQTEVVKRCETVLAQSAQTQLTGGCEQDSKSFIYAKDLLASSTAAAAPKMWVIETNGSHIPYSYLIPKDFEKWQPMCRQEVEGIPKCTTTQLRNEYDNTVLYTDYLLADLLASLKDRKAMVFYAADHGQHLGEHGLHGHGYMVGEEAKTSREQLNVAGLAWMSPSAQAAYPQAWQALKANAGRYMGHDVLFHSVLGCAGVTSSLLDASRNLCAPNFQENSALKRQYAAQP